MSTMNDSNAFLAFRLSGLNIGDTGGGQEQEGLNVSACVEVDKSLVVGGQGPAACPLGGS